jgi:hypothetical protein
MYRIFFRPVFVILFGCISLNQLNATELNSNQSPTPTPASKSLLMHTPNKTPTVSPTVTPTTNVRTGLSIGWGWPYVSLKYFFNDDFGIEGRFANGVATGDSIDVYAGRLYFNLAHLGNIVLFTGAEGGYIDFNNQGLIGNGFEIAPFLGGEYFFVDRVSCLADFAPTYINIGSGGFTSDGIEWVFNLGFYFYPF